MHRFIGRSNRFEADKASGRPEEDPESFKIVMKFGGSSVASATAIEWVARILKSLAGACGISDGKDHRPACGDDATRGAWIRVFGVVPVRGACRFHSQGVKRLLGAGATGVLGKRIAPKFRELHGLLMISKTAAS
jgi:hypothetical protein